MSISDLVSDFEEHGGVDNVHIVEPNWKTALKTKIILTTMIVKNTLSTLNLDRSAKHYQQC
jgi:hypothetical protein